MYLNESGRAGNKLESTVRIRIWDQYRRGWTGAQFQISIMKIRNLTRNL